MGARSQAAAARLGSAGARTVPPCVKPAPVIVSEHRKGERGACSSITQKSLLACTNCSLAMLTDKELWRVRLFVERHQEAGLRDKTSHRTGECLIRCTTIA
jgi:hypothetical protein